MTLCNFYILASNLQYQLELSSCVATGSESLHRQVLTIIMMPVTQGLRLSLSYYYY